MASIEVIWGLYCGTDKGKSHFYTSPGQLPNWPWDFLLKYMLRSLPRLWASFLFFLLSFSSMINLSNLIILSNNALGLWPCVLFERMTSLTIFNLYIRLGLQSRFSLIQTINCLLSLICSGKQEIQILFISFWHNCWVWFGWNQRQRQRKCVGCQLGRYLFQT